MSENAEQKSKINEKLNGKAAKVFVVFNPVAGVQNAPATREIFETSFNSAGWDYEIYETTGEESVPDLVRQAAKRGANLIVAAGGDGTVAGVAAGVAKLGVPMAIVPAGTGNSLARELGIPLDFEAAMQLLLGEHQVRRLDGLQVEDALFLLNVGIGISARTIRDTKREQKRRFGILAYVWNIVRSLSKFNQRTFDLDIDGRRHRIIASELMILNSGMIGVQELPQELQICPDDGKVEIYVVRAQTANDYVSVFWRLLVGKKNQHPKVQTLVAERNIDINTRRPLTVQADGEVIGRTPVKVRILPHAVNIVVPPPV